MFCKTGAWLPPVQREPFGRARLQRFAEDRSQSYPGTRSERAAYRS